MSRVVAEDRPDAGDGEEAAEERFGVEGRDGMVVRSYGIVRVIGDEEWVGQIGALLLAPPYQPIKSGTPGAPAPGSRPKTSAITPSPPCHCPDRQL